MFILELFLGFSELCTLSFLNYSMDAISSRLEAIALRFLLFVFSFLI